MIRELRWLPTFLLILLIPVTCEAQTVRTWTGGAGDANWNDQFKWTSSVPDTTDEIARIASSNSRIRISSSTSSYSIYGLLLSGSGSRVSIQRSSFSDRSLFLMGSNSQIAAGASIFLGTEPSISSSITSGWLGGNSSTNALINNGVIRGSGTISVGFNNSATGQICADLAGYSLEILGGSKLNGNGGSLIASNGGTLRLRASGINSSGGSSGQIVAESNSIVEYQTNVIGGWLRGSGTHRITGNTLISNASIDASHLDVEQGALQLSNTGVIVNHLNVDSTLRLQSNSDGSIHVSGNLTNQGVIQNESGASRTISGTVSNSGVGQIFTNSNSQTTFTGAVTHNGLGIVTETGSQTTFTDSYTGAGDFQGTGSVVFEDEIRLGNSAGVVNFAGDVTLGSTAITAIELAGTALGEFDRFQIVGDLQLDGALSVGMLDGFNLAGGMEFQIANVQGSTSGVFDNLSEGDLVTHQNGVNLFITYQAGDGNDVALFTSIPEPTGLLPCLLACGWILRRRR